jgi:hypothetical protein
MEEDEFQIWAKKHNKLLIYFIVIGVVLFMSLLIFNVPNVQLKVNPLHFQVTNIPSVHNSPCPKGDVYDKIYCLYKKGETFPGQFGMSSPEN